MIKYRLSLVLASLCLTLSLLSQTRFDNTTSFTVPDLGPATLYPSTIEVSGLDDYLSDIEIIIPSAFYVGDYEEMEMLLQSPDGQQFLLMSDVDLGPFFGLFTDLSFSLSADQLIDRQTADNRTPFLPSDYGSTPDTLPAPGPGVVNNLPRHLYPLEGINPNGSWKLFVYNSRANQVIGTFDEGWSLVITDSVQPVCPRPLPPNIRTGSLTSNQIVIDWGSYTDNTFDLYFGPTPLPEPNAATAATLSNLVDTSQLLDNLLPNVKYELFLRSNCGNSQGNWQGPVTFEMEEACPSPIPRLELCQFYTADELAVTQGWDVDPSGSQYLSAYQYTFSFTPNEEGVYNLEDFASLEADTLLRLAMKTADGSCNEKEGWQYLGGDAPYIELPFLTPGTNYTFVYQTTHPEVSLRISSCPSTFTLSMPNFLEGPYSFKPQLLDNGARTEGDFDFYYGPAPLAQPNSETTPTEQITDLQINQTLGGDLLPDTEYELYIRRRCEGQISCWSQAFAFKTEADCGVLIYDGPENTSATTVDLLFTAEEAVPIWIFEFGPAPYSPNVNGTRFSGSIEDGRIRLALESLQPNTDYDLYFTPSCSPNGLNPTYGPIRFSTNGDCNAVANPIECGVMVENRFQVGDGTPVQAGSSCPGGNLFASRVYSFLAGETGTASLNFAGSGASSNATASFSYAPEEGSCSIGQFTGLGCWEIQGNNYPTLYMPVEAGKRYYLLCQVAKVTGASPFARFDFSIENCGFLAGTCPPIDTIQATLFNGENIRLSWPTVNAECYDILYGPIDEVLDTNTQIPQQECWQQEFFVINRASNIVPYQYYIRSRCNDEYTPWQWGRFPNEASLLHQSVGSMDFCAPYIIQEGQSRSFSTFAFKTKEAGIYTFKVQSSSEGLSGFSVYRDTISEENFVSLVDGFGVFEGGALLEENTKYIGRFDAPTPPSNGFVEYIVESWGLHPFQEVGEFDDSGVYGATGQVPLTETLETASYSCLGVEDWRHFYFDNNTPSNRADDQLLLSIQDFPGLIDQTSHVASGGSAGASLITKPPADYIQNESGIVIMNRYWEVDIDEAQQPSEPVQVRFYWHLDDFDQLQIKMEEEGLSLPNNFSDLFFYKINGDYNANPVEGHSGIPAATSLAGDGYWEYYYNPQPADNYYQLGTHTDGNPYVQFPVAVFSGGGGGAAADGGGAILVDVLQTNAPEGYWQIYPNPVRDHLFIRRLNKKTDYTLIHSQGAIIQQGTMSNQGIDMTKLYPGYYILQLRDGLYSSTFKLVVVQ